MTPTFAGATENTSYANAVPAEQYPGNAVLLTHEGLTLSTVVNQAYSDDR